MPRRAHGEWQLLAIWWSVVIVIAEAWVLQCLRHCSLVWTPFCFQQLHLYRLWYFSWKNMMTSEKIWAWKQLLNMGSLVLVLVTIVKCFNIYIHDGSFLLEWGKSYWDLPMGLLDFSRICCFGLLYCSSKFLTTLQCRQSRFKCANKKWVCAGWDSCVPNSTYTKFWILFAAWLCKFHGLCHIITKEEGHVSMLIVGNFEKVC